MKVGLIGCAGLGKGTICRRVSELKGIPFLESKTATRPVLEKALYQYSPYSFVETRLAAREYEFEIASSRIQLEAEHDSFITDRTTLECLAYAFLRLETYTVQDFKMLESVCQQHMRVYDRLYYIPCDMGWQTDNGLRTVNREFQWMADRLIKGVIERWRVTVSTPIGDDIESVSQYIAGEIR